MDPIFQEVLARTWSEPDLAALSDVSVAVNTSLAGKFLLARLREAKVDRETASAWLRHAARYAPVEEMDNLADVARKRIPEAGNAELHAELDRQFGLFQAVDQGLRQRGADLPDAVRSWGGDLAKAVLGKRPSSTWSNAPLPEKATENPWVFEERRRSDGRPFRSLSSFPRGEQLTGSLRSPAFVLPHRLEFWLCGHDGFPATKECRPTASHPG
jgi:hypothetical protein